jgi:biotin synthase-like enzyme
MGETRRQGAGLLQQLPILNPHHESVPINLLIQVPGTPLHGLPEFESLELVRAIAAARIVMPESTIRLSAGRSSMSEETHALCLHAGASAFFSVIGSSRPTTTATTPMLRFSISSTSVFARSISGSPSNPEPGRPDVHAGRSPTMLARSMMRTSG